MSKIIINITDLIYRINKGKSIASSPAYNPEKIEIISSTIIENFAIVVFILLIAFVVYKKKPKLLLLTIIVLTVMDLFIFSGGDIITIPIKIANKPNKVRDWLAQNITQSRFLSTSGNLPFTGLGVYWTHLRAREPFSPNQVTDEELITFSRFADEISAIGENQGLPTKIFDISGYAAVIPKNFLYFWEEKPSSHNTIGIESLTDERLNIAGVKFIVTGFPQDYIKNLIGERYKLVYEHKDIKVYENLQVLPRAFVQYRDRIIKANIIEYLPNKVVIETDDLNSRSNLILTDNFFPGWKASINGKEAPIEAYMNTFRMLRIPPGKHVVEFVYQSSSFKIGAIISVVAAIFLVFKFSWEKRK
jgi:hypothetical protein